MQSSADTPSPDAVSRLVASHRDFLAFLGRRLPTPEAAEDILQAAFVRALEKSSSIRDSESAVAWFYRLLRNAVTDHYRSRGVELRGKERHAHAVEQDYALEFQTFLCSCIEHLLPNLKPEYATVLRRVELERASLAEVAGELGITSNNAAVRVHRARQALKRELERACGTCATHGCLDCACSSSGCRHAPDV